ncbi:hypothetical protein D3C75_1053370 [compost metagenome]
MRRQRLIIIIIPDLIRQAELVTQQKHRHYQVRLFQHLMPVNYQRMVVEQQRIFIGWCMLEIPFFLGEKRVVLSINAKSLIKGDKHFIRRFQPH